MPRSERSSHPITMINNPTPSEYPMAATGTLSDSATRTVEDVPARIRNIAMLRGLGYTFREIGEEFGVSPQAVSLMLSRHQRAFRKLRGAVEFRELSSRAVNALGRHGIRSRHQALAADVLGLLANQRNCGKKTLEEIERWMLEESSGNAAGADASSAAVSSTQADAVSPDGDAPPVFEESGLMAAGTA